MTKHLLIINLLIPILILQSCTKKSPDNLSEKVAQWIGPENILNANDLELMSETEWIWMPYQRANPAFNAPEIPVYFRKSFELTNISEIESARISITADNAYNLYLNGQFINKSDDFTLDSCVVLPHLKEGKNTLAILAKNLTLNHTNIRGVGRSSAGLISRLQMTTSDGKKVNIDTDDTWKYTTSASENWESTDFNDDTWQKAISTGRKGLNSWNGFDNNGNKWYRFRKKLILNNTPSFVKAKIAVDSKYWLWINGKLAVFEGSLKRGPNPKDTYYDEVNLTQYFKEGENTIALLVWYWGRSSFSHNNSGKAGLYFELEADHIKLVSDNSWKMKTHEAYGSTDAPHPNYRLAEYNIHYNAQKDDESWIEKDYVDTSWDTPFEFGPAQVSPWDKLVKRPIPMWFDTGLKEYSKIERINGHDDYDTLLGYLPTNSHITPYFKIEADAGKSIDIRTENYLGGSEYNLRSEYITKDGTQEFEALSWINGHIVKYAIPKSIKVIELKYRETGFDAPVLGSFNSNDKFYNELWQKSLRTLQVCMRDNYFDCPDRERAQWWGDAVIEIGQTFYALDRVSDSLTKKSIRELVDWKKEDGSLYSPIPGNWRAELPGQMLMSVGKYGFWNYFVHTNDSSIIKYVYPSVKSYLKLWDIDDRGLVVHRTGAWDWGDWGSNKDMALMDNCYYTLALQAAVEMAKLTGNEADIDFYQDRINSIKNGFNTYFWNGKEYRSPEYKGETDDRGNGLAVIAHIAEPDKFDQIAKVLSTQYYASPYLEKYVIEALFLMNKTDQAMQRMKDRFTVMVASSSSTLYEGWGVGSKGYGGGTINHSWSGGPLILLSQYIAGIAPLTPGYSTFEVIPNPSFLEEISVSVPAIKGQINATIQNVSNEFRISVSIPNTTKAIVGIPIRNTQAVEKINLNGQTIFANGKDVEQKRKISKTSTHFTLELESGEWELEANYKE